MQQQHILIIFISHCYYKYTQTLAFQKKSSFCGKSPVICWNAGVRWASADFCVFGQNKSVFWAECHLEDFVQLLRCFFLHCCLHLSFQRASLQRNNLLSGLDLAECVRSLNFFMLSMQKGYIHITGYWQSWQFLKLIDFLALKIIHLKTIYQKKYEAHAEVKSLNHSQASL